MPPALTFHLLGPLEVRADGVPLSVGAPKQQTILALLALNAGRAVQLDELVDEVWPDRPPPSAVANVRTYAASLRRQFESVERRRERLVRQGSGYRLNASAAEVDVLAFVRDSAAGREALRRGEPAEAATKLTGCLDPWRGAMLAGLPLGPQLSARCAAVEEQRRNVKEDLAEAHLASGEPERAVALLPEHVRANPLRERAHALLMRALYHSGDVAGALARYAEARSVLVDTLGIEPGHELQELHVSMLNRDPRLDTQSRRPELSRVSRQLPAPPQTFTGRATELAELDKVHDASTVVITAIDGMAGVGKTALAVQAAHQMVDRYSDGQLFLDLHGYTQGVAAIGPGEALERLLRALGVPGERIPAGLDERAGLYRSRLADQRILIVLDNAATETQVTPLLPGAPGCLVLVTSRRRLAGLDHTHTLSLDTLPPADAVMLLRHTAGDSRLAGQPQELVAELVELCGRLPLAIRIAAARLRSHPTWDLAHLTQRLRDQQHRLGELTAGQRSVTAALDLSYQDLADDLQRTYRLLGLHPGADIDQYATAALLDSTLPEAGQLLEQLLEAHLLQEPVPGRYRFHDLTRAHAASQDETEQGRRQALDRLLDHYRHTAVVAMDTAYPYERERRPQVPPARTPSPALPDPAAAVSWLDSELPNLLATASYATEHDRPAHLLHLSTILHPHLRTRGPYHDAVTLHQQALTTARAAGHQTAGLEALVGLGHIHRLQGRYQQATDHLQQALQLARNIGHRPAELEALVGLGHIHRWQGRYEQATDCYQLALRLARAAGYQTAELEALAGLGDIPRLQGRHEQATDHYQRALRLARATGHHPGELNALAGLGHIHRLQGRYEQATDHYQQGLRLARTTGNRIGELLALVGLGDIHRMQGRYGQATDHYRRLLDLAQQAGDRNWQFEARQGLGRVQHAIGHPDAALAHHDRALALATELGHPEDQARAHDGLARAQHALHLPEQARAHWQHALDILTRLGVDHTDDEETTAAAIRTHLANLGRRENNSEPTPGGVSRGIRRPR